MRTEGRTDVANLTAAFRNFAKAPKTNGMEISRGGEMVTAYFHLLLRFRIRGTIRLLPLHAFIAWTEPNPPLKKIYIYV